MELVTLLPLAIGLGLLGFIEPCTIGTSLVFLKQLDGLGRREAALQTALFVATRALVIGLLGAAAALVGAAFAGFQRLAWLVLGTLLAALGLAFLTGRAGVLMVRLGPGLERFGDWRARGIGLGLLFGLNIPACAAPLLFGTLGAAAIAAQDPLWGVVQGFLTLALFGLALSLPLVALVLWPRTRRLLDRALARSARLPRVIGGVLVALGLWSVWFGLFVMPLP
jgi:cytochrome c-type biogenesis protein